MIDPLKVRREEISIPSTNLVDGTEKYPISQSVVSVVKILTPILPWELAQTSFTSLCKRGFPIIYETRWYGAKRFIFQYSMCHIETVHYRVKEWEIEWEVDKKTIHSTNPS